MNTNNKPLSLIIKDNAELHAHYMPFIESGAIFVPTKEEYNIGDKATAYLLLKQLGKKIPIQGTVVWITPDIKHTNTKAGIGIQFTGTNAEKIKQFIERMLGTLLNTPPTKTAY